MYYARFSRYFHLTPAKVLQEFFVSGNLANINSKKQLQYKL